MKHNIPSRRKFLRNTFLASLGLSALGSTNAFSAILDTKKALFGYLPNSPFTKDLRKAGSNVSPVTVQGIIYDRQSQRPFSNIKVEVWHLSPDNELMSYRAQFTTSDLGRYSFITDFPGHGPQLKPRIFFKLSANGKERFNHLIFDSNRAYVDHKQWADMQNQTLDVHPKLTLRLDTYNIQFNQTL